MSTYIRQTLAMTKANLGSLPRRLWLSLSMAFSIALVVAVLLGFLAMAKGFERILQDTGSPSVSIILGGGTNQEIGSEISPDVVRNLQAADGDTGIARDERGNLVLSREILVPVNAQRQADNADQTLSLRGMDETGPALRDRAKLSKGRLFTPGSREIVVGARIADDFPGFGIGDKIRLGSVDWTVVGHFSSSGSAFESEIWGSLEAVQSAFDRQGNIQIIRARLNSPTGLMKLQATLNATAKTPLVTVTEADFYSAQSKPTSRLIRLFGWPIALLMAVGAAAGALNTMMSSVSDRTIEIATVRALGFSRRAAFLATWIEAVSLSIVGALAGVAVSWLAFNGWQASTLGANNTRMTFNLSVTPDVMLQAGLLAVAIGIISGALPAFAASGLPLSSAIRKRG